VTTRHALVPAPDVAVEARNGTVYVARLPEGPIVVLRDVAALIWDAAQDGDRESIADRVALRVARPVAEIEPDVSSFVAGLIAGGLLVGDG